MTFDALATFEVERPRLRALAYRMLGSMADADDVVQETWLRWDGIGPAARDQVERPAAWLTTATSRVALDRLKSAQHQREEYVGPWLPEPVLTDDDPAVSAELAESLTLGFLAVLERLGPVERAVFLLADVFREPFSAIAPVVGRSEEACRQIASRARRRVRDHHRPLHADPANTEELIGAFMAACAFGDIDQLRRVLTDDVVLISDGGREVHAARRPVLGFHRVGRFLMSVSKRLATDLDIERHEVNGEPGLVFSQNGRVSFVMVFEQHADRIAAIRLVINPGKLRSLRR
jgi:RNA polymerase sigma-70 factor (ECF subfamily)